MKKLIVCGCSYAADSLAPKLIGTGFGLVLAKKLGWDVQILARQGSSNGGIRIQIDEALRQRPDFVIVAPTFHDRMEIPASAAPYEVSDELLEQLRSDPNNRHLFNSPLQSHLQSNQGNGYDPEYGINNLNYKNNAYRIISETIFSLAENYDHPYRAAKIDKNTQEAVKQYINFMYDSNWKRQQDEWIMRDGVMQLFHAGIPFFLLANNLWTTENVRSVIPSVVPDKYMTLDFKQTPAYATNEYPWKGKLWAEDPGYHGDPKSQEYLADVYYKVITEDFGIEP
jgi:hypothetical protein